MKRSSLIAIVAATAAGLAWMPAASAQTMQQQSPPQQQMQQQNFSDADLKSYAAAAGQVQQISNDYLPQIQSAETPQAQQAARAEATQKMVQAIEQQGLSVEQYNQITSVVRVDPETAQKVTEYMK